MTDQTLTIDVTDNITGGTAIDAAIKEVPAAYAKAHSLVQDIAFAIVSHASLHGDCTRALHLVRAVPIQQARSLIAYFMAVSPIGVLLSEGAKDDKCRFLKPESKSYNPFDLDKARALQWWTLDSARAEKEAIAVYAGGLFDDIVKQLQRAIDNEGKGKKYTDDAIQAALQLKSIVEAHRTKYLAGLAASDTSNDDTPAETEDPVGKEQAA